MSQVALSGNALGTGTFTIASPNSNTNRTLDLPDASGTILTTATPGVPVNGPAFNAFKTANQSISGSTWTLVSFQSEDFDTASAFNTSTARFNPQVAGYYQINWNVGGETSSTPSRLLSAVWKNGSEYRRSSDITGYYGVSGSTLVVMNGSTDYLEIYAYISATSASVAGGGSLTSFSGFLARSAT